MSLVRERWPVLLALAVLGTILGTVIAGRDGKPGSVHAQEAEAEAPAGPPPDDNRHQVAAEPELAPEGGGTKLEDLPAAERQAIEQANAEDEARRGGLADQQGDVYHQALIQRAAVIEAQRKSGVEVAP
jgi:hypothetical protein